MQVDVSSSKRRSPAQEVQLVGEGPEQVVHVGWQETQMGLEVGVQVPARNWREVQSEATVQVEQMRLEDALGAVVS
jgi:hypothetical protein